MSVMNKARAGQIDNAAAAIYERHFVPALFSQFGPMLAEAAEIRPGETVLDVASGTGVAARAASERVGPTGRVTAIDINPDMLAVASARPSPIVWLEAAAEDLPFDDASFDAVLCQFGMMFFADRSRALREMARVTRPGGRMAVLTFAPLARSPAYDRLVPLLEGIVGKASAEALSAPFVLGERSDIDAELARAGMGRAEYRNLVGTARHASIDDWLDTEIGGWTLADMVSKEQLAELKAAASSRLAEFVAFDGRVAFPAPALLTIIRP